MPFFPTVSLSHSTSLGTMASLSSGEEQPSRSDSSLTFLPANSNSFDVYVKVVLLGDSGVGKTGIMQRFTDNEFHANTRSTIGVEFSTKSLRSMDGEVVRAQIWDTAGQERYRTIAPFYYRGAGGIILLYDVTSRCTFDNLQKWLDNIRDHIDPEALVMLVGNKTDLHSQRQVSTQEGRALAEAKGFFFLETSALDGSNVHQAFTEIIQQVYDQKRRQRQEQDPQQKPRLPTSIRIIPNRWETVNERQQQQWGCCS